VSDPTTPPPATSSRRPDVSDPTTFRFTVGWRSYLMTGADALKVMELLCKAVCADIDYLDGEEGLALVEDAATLLMEEA